MTALLERLEGARVGSRELDAEMLRAFCPSASIGTYINGDDGDIVFHAEGFVPNKHSVPAYTTSIDAALALAERVLPGWYCGVQPWFHTDPDRVMSRAYFVRPDWKRWNPVDDEWVECQSGKSAASPALAICAALIRATAKEGAGG